jgi:hypothetical protein
MGLGSDSGFRNLPKNRVLGSGLGWVFKKHQNTSEIPIEKLFFLPVTPKGMNQP